MASHPTRNNVSNEDDDTPPLAHCAPVLVVGLAGTTRTAARVGGDEEEQSWVATVPSSTTSSHHRHHEDDNEVMGRCEENESPPEGQVRRRRCCCSLGKWILMGMNVAAVLSSILTNLSCRFFSLPNEILTNTVDSPLLLDISPFNVTSLGLFGYSSSSLSSTTNAELSPVDLFHSMLLSPQSSCHPYDDISPFLNSPFGGDLPFLMVAQWVAVLASVLGGIAVTVQLIEAVRVACCSSSSTTRKTTSSTNNNIWIIFALLGLAMLLQGMTFGIYGDMRFW